MPAEMRVERQPLGGLPEQVVLGELRELAALVERDRLALQRRLLRTALLFRKDRISSRFATSRYPAGVKVDLVILDERRRRFIPVVDDFAILRVCGSSAGTIVEIHADIFATSDDSSFDILPPRFPSRFARCEAGETPMSNRLFRCLS